MEVRCTAGGGGEGGGGLTARVNLSFLVVQDLCAQESAREHCSVAYNII